MKTGYVTPKECDVKNEKKGNNLRTLRKRIEYDMVDIRDTLADKRDELPPWAYCWLDEIGAIDARDQAIEAALGVSWNIG